ncbi:MAG: DUF3341 domain-containing protein [Wenzhouxiangellaceae bacterium]|nr:DUF3341 domain-containing protein [Wenzhouxiangellaceae bacterium]
MSELSGWLAEFDEVDDLVEAAHRLVDAGHERVEAFTPFPVEALDSVLPPPRDRVTVWVLAGATVGALGGYALQVWTAVFDYPWLVGGKPMHSWPTFLPVSFELAVLLGSLAGFLGMLIGNGLPRLHHPMFAAKDFDLATRDRFFLYLPGQNEAREALAGLDPVHLHEVPGDDDAG